MTFRGRRMVELVKNKLIFPEEMNEYSSGSEYAPQRHKPSLETDLPRPSTSGVSNLRNKTKNKSKYLI